MKHESTEYDKFISLVDRVLSVPHAVIKQRVEEERKKAALKPNKRGPRPKVKPSA